jgi:DNA-binding transcriptional regulator YiaG
VPVADFRRQAGHLNCLPEIESRTHDLVYDLIMSTLGQLIEGARTRLALSQEALAALLDVSQQTVSRWEHGHSGPRPQVMAELLKILDIDAAELAAVSGGPMLSAAVAARGTSTADGSAQRPLAALLPFPNLTPEEFERAVADLMQCRFPDAKVNQLGSQGDDQRGFDVLVVQPDGHRIGIQCKRTKQFGPQQVKAAVEAAELDVDESFLVLSREATAAARFELDQHAGWQVWDRVDLSRLVRLLEPETALCVMRTYFPGQIDDFLGLSSARPWLSAEEFYRPSPHVLLDHRQPLVGRAHLVDELASWVSDPGKGEIGMVFGRGGVGKSKLLWEVASRSAAAGIHIRFLAIGQQPVAGDFEQLPRTGSLLIVLDDAHAVEHVAGIISQLWLARPRARVLLAARPYGRTELEAELWRLNQAPRALSQWELEDLTQAEAAEFVADLISRQVHDPFTQQVAAISRDCPFVAVVAADLYRRQELKATLVSDAVLRREVFRRFADHMTGPAGGADAAERRAVLTSLAVFQPVRLDDPDFESAVAAHAGIASWDVVNGRIRELEDAGLVLRRRMTAVRVIPDMFADVLVGNGAYDDRSGLPTSLLARAQRVASGAALLNLLVNASRIDWQARDSSSKRAVVLDDLWSGLREELVGGSFGEQVSLLNLVTRVAYFQPDLALQLAVDILEGDEDDEPQADAAEWRWAATRADVINACVPVLQNVAYHLSYTRRALDRLWALAVKDERPPNRHPGHPLRALQEIADLRVGKPFKYIDALIDAAADWLRTPSRVSPFDVLEPILATEGTYEISTESTLTLGSFRISPDSVRPLRQRVIDLAVTHAKSSDIPRAVRAVTALGHAIRGPVGLYNRSPSQDEKAAWALEFLPVIDHLGQLGADPALDPATRVVIRETLGWYADHSDTATKAAAQGALSQIVNTAEDDLAACIHDGWSQLARGVDQGFLEAQRGQEAEFSRVAAAISDGCAEQDVLNRLEHRLRIERMTSERIDGAVPFIAFFLAGQPAAASLLCERALAGDLPELSNFAGHAIGALAGASDIRAIAFASSMLASEDPVLQGGAATGLSWNRAGRAGLLPGEDTILAAMAAHDNDNVRAMAGNVAFIIGLTDAAFALDLLAKIEFRRSPAVAAEALRGFLPNGPFSWSGTPAALRTSLLNQLVSLSTIGKYEITGALSELSAVEPLRVTRLLIERVERQVRLQAPGYNALPYNWNPPLRVEQTPELGRCLAEVLDWMTRCGHDLVGRQLNDDGAGLYALVANGWNDQALASLSEVGDTFTEAALVSAARVLAHAPLAVLSGNVPLVAELLRRAESLGEESAEMVFRALSITTGMIVTWMADPAQQDQQEVERLRQITERLPRGSAEHRFFTQLTARAELHLSWTARDLSWPRHDGREW